MPQIERWDSLPEGVRRHLIDRMRDRAIRVADLNQLRLWTETQPQVPEGDWYKDFGSFKICGSGSYPKTFLLREQVAKVKPSNHLDGASEHPECSRHMSEHRHCAVSYNLSGSNRNDPSTDSMSEQGECLE